jgi:hypothetical protein
MKELLANDFINHYNRHPEIPIQNKKLNLPHYCTNNERFEIKDEVNKIESNGEKMYGIARYLNPDKLKITIINYEKFITSLPPRVKNTNDIVKGICDYIVYSPNYIYFLLNELTNTDPKFIMGHENTEGKQEGKLAKAQRQLKHSLEVINNVPTIHNYIQRFIKKQCCFFNSYPTPVPDINALQAFNQFNKIDTSEPDKLIIREIEALGFDFVIYSNEQTYVLKDQLSDLEAIAEQLTKLSKKEIKELTQILNPILL